MGKYVLIACCKQKANIMSKASDLYISDLFKKSMAYAKTLLPDNIFILSAKYGLLELDRVVEPYDETLNNKSANERKAWAKKVLDDLRKATDLKNDEYIFLAGNKYREYLLPEIENYYIPLKGLGIGPQKRWLKENTHE